MIFSAMPYSLFNSALDMDGQKPMLRPIRLILAGLTALLLTQPALAQERYGTADLQEELAQLDKALSKENLDSVISKIDLNISEARHDPVRTAALLTFKAEKLRFHGISYINENLSKVFNLISYDKQPELYIYAMTVKSYEIYAYQNNPELAVNLLENIQKNLN